MAVDEPARHDLYVGLEELLGRKRAETMMTLLPASGWGDVVRVHHLDAARVELRAEMAEVHARLDVLEERIQSSKHEVVAHMSGQLRTLVVALAGFQVSTAALAFAAARLV